MDEIAIVPKRLKGVSARAADDAKSEAAAHTSCVPISSASTISPDGSAIKHCTERTQDLKECAAEHVTIFCSAAQDEQSLVSMLEKRRGTIQTDEANEADSEQTLRAAVGFRRHFHCTLLNYTQLMMN